MESFDRYCVELVPSLHLSLLSRRQKFETELPEHFVVQQVMLESALTGWIGDWLVGSQTRWPPTDRQHLALPIGAEQVFEHLTPRSLVVEPTLSMRRRWLSFGPQRLDADFPALLPILDLCNRWH